MMFRMVRRNPESKTCVRFILFLKYVVWACVFTAASFTYEEKWQAATVLASLPPLWSTERKGIGPKPAMNKAVTFSISKSLFSFPNGQHDGGGFPLQPL